MKRHISYQKGFASIFIVVFLLVLAIGVIIYRENTKNKTQNPLQEGIPTSVNQQTEFEKTFIKQPQGTETQSSQLDPFSAGTVSNLTNEQKTNLLYDTKLETAEKNNKLYDTVYLIDKKTQNQIEIFSKQIILYPWIASGSNEKPKGITAADEIKNQDGDGVRRKVFGHSMSSNNKYVVITTEDEIFIYNINDNSLTTVYDQNTPEDVFPVDIKYKSGYDYCYAPPFIFSPDGNKVLVHKCLWEGSELLFVDMAKGIVKDVHIPVGFGSQFIGWSDNNAILFYDIHRREKDGMYSLNTNTFKEALLFSDKGELKSANVIDGKIYISMRDEGYLDLYIYDFTTKSMHTINHIKNDFENLNTTMNIWKENNVINWDIVLGEDIYRYQSSL